MRSLGRLVALCVVAAAVFTSSAPAATPPPLAPGSSPDGYPPSTHFPTSCTNKCDIGRGGNAVSHVVFLSSEAGKAATIATEQNDPGKSIHYFAANDGSVSDFVPEADTAWYAGDHLYNQTSIGIIVEGFVSTPSSFGDLDYQRAAQLTAAIAHRYGFPIDPDHVLGRGDISTSSYAGSGPDPAFDLVRLRSLAQAYRDELEPPAFTGSAPPPATVGAAYNFQYTASANGPVTFAVSSGTVPDGLALSESGVLSGTPTTSRSFTFTVTVNRPSGVSASRTDTIMVAPPAQTGTGGNSTGGPTNTATAPTSAEIRTSLVAQLTPTGKAARIAAIQKHRGYVLAFTALASGQLRVRWYFLPKGAHLARAKPVLVASGVLTYSAAGRRSVKLRLTRAGRRLLKHAKRLRLTARGTFTPTGGQPVVAKRAFTLKR